MNEKLDQYLNGVFAPYEGVKSVADLKADLLSDLQERFRELKAGGQDDDTAFAMTIDSIGDIEQTVQEIASLSRSLERQVLMTFSGASLPEGDFAGVAARKRTFEGSTLRGSSFANADLTGSQFKDSDIREASFDGANLTDCVLSTCDLSGAAFNKTILVRTTFNKLGLNHARFADVRLVDARLDMVDLRGAVFESCVFSGVYVRYSDFRDAVFTNCVFNGVDFESDLRGICFDGQTFIGVRFDRAGLADLSLKGATLKNTSFTPPFSLTKKYYNAIKSIRFDGAAMDKLTYAGLKGLGADVSNVMVI